MTKTIYIEGKEGRAGVRGPKGDLALCLVGLLPPLLRKSDALGFIADRTISLPFFFAIRSIKRMTTLAHRFSFVDRSKRARVLKGILPHGYKPKMPYRNAASILAQMINNHSIGDSSIVRKVSDPVGSPSLFSKVKRAVSILIKRALPQTTFTYLFPFTIESFCLFFGPVFHVGHSTPSCSLVNR